MKARLIGERGSYPLRRAIRGRPNCDGCGRFSCKIVSNRCDGGKCFALYSESNHRARWITNPTRGVCGAWIPEPEDDE